MAKKNPAFDRSAVEAVTSRVGKQSSTAFWPSWFGTHEVQREITKTGFETQRLSRTAQAELARIRSRRKAENPKAQFKRVVAFLQDELTDRTLSLDEVASLAEAVSRLVKRPRDFLG